jgi:hypothetical protein
MQAGGGGRQACVGMECGTQAGQGQEGIVGRHEGTVGHSGIWGSRVATGRLRRQVFKIPFCTIS